MPRFPKPGERQGGYKMGQFMNEGEEVLYGNNKTASQDGQDYTFDEDDDDDLYS